MALTLEAALVFPLSISLVIGLVPPAVRNYRRIAAEASAYRKAVRMVADPSSIYLLAPIADTSQTGIGKSGNGDGNEAGAPGLHESGVQPADVLLTSPKMVFSLVTAIIDDLAIIGLVKP